MGKNNESTADFANPESNENNKLVNKLSVQNVSNNENDSTDSIECDSKYVSSNDDKCDNGGEKKQSYETKFNSPPDIKPIGSGEKCNDFDNKINEQSSSIPETPSTLKPVEGNDVSDTALPDRIITILKSKGSTSNSPRSIFPIISAKSLNIEVNLLLDPCNEITLVSKDLVKAINATVEIGPKIQIEGVNLANGETSNEYVTIPITFEQGSVKLSALVVDGICSDIVMPNLNKRRKLKNISFSMIFDQNQRFTTFPIDVLVGVDAMKDLVKANKVSENENEMNIQVIDSLLLVTIGNKVVPFGVDNANKNKLEASSSPPRDMKSLVSVSDKHPAMATYLDEILYKFFESEQNTLGRKTIRERINDDHDQKFGETYKLENNPAEPTAMRISVKPLWKDIEYRPPYDPYDNTKNVLVRFHGLERKLKFARNAKMKLAYHKGIKDGIEKGTFKFLGMFKDLKEEFETSFPIEG